MYSTEKLVTEVQNYPCIWDMSSSDYSNRDLKNVSWLKIAEAVYNPEWDNLSKTEKEEKVKELKNKKWKHIRDAYLKYTSEEKNIRSGSEGIKKKPYAYAEIMSFLNTTATKRKTTDNFESTENDAFLDISERVVNENLQTAVASTVHSNQNQKSNKKSKITPFQSNLLEQLKKNQEATSNPDINIVMSFLPYLKKLDDEQKLDFQLNGLQYLKNVIKHNCPPTQFDQQNVLRQPQYPIPNAPFLFNNYSMTQNSPSNLQYSSSAVSQPYICPTYTPPSNYYSHNSSSSHVEHHDPTSPTPLTPQPLPSKK